ncbi:MAG: putative glycosyl transferase, partial [Acidobacteria bacterium]|nr:putative glycosyl transferase [Acidobacteriota bacterium]
QPGEEPAPLEGDRFEFRSSVAQRVREVVGCNFSVKRAAALAVGGFDESFVGAAYRFEADFCARASAAGAQIVFEPRASLRHLRAARGGTRAYGSHLTTMRPHHAVGEYYFLLRHRPRGWLGQLLGRPWRAVATRFHARRPWRIPVTWVAELTGLAWAIGLVARPPRLLPRAAGQGDALP